MIEIEPVSSHSRRRIFLVALLAILVLLAAGCSGESDDASENEGTGTESSGDTGGEAVTPTGPLVVSAPLAPATLDLQANACGFHDQWSANAYVQLTRHAAIPGPTEDAWGRPLEGLEVTVMDVETLEPYLVDWDESEDGKVYTLHIDPNATFEDGSPIDAQAIKASIDRAEALASCGSYFWIAGQYDNIPTAEVIDPQTLVLTFSRPNSSLLAGWATTPSSPYSPASMAEHPDEEGTVVNEYFAGEIGGGGGPYLLDQYTPGEGMRLSRNPNFFGEPAFEEEAIVNWVGSESTLLLQARNGQADVTYELSPESVEQLRDNPNVTVLSVPAFQHWNINLNWKHPPLDNVKVREALTYAVPYEEILEEVAKGFGTIYYGPIAQNVPFFNRELSAPREFDLDRASQLLDEAGVPTPLNLELVVQEGSGIPERVATILQQIWRQIDINLKVTKLGPTEYNETVEGHKAQMSIRLDGPGAPTPAWLLNYDMKCDVPFNLADICIPEADELLAQADASTDPEEQQRLYDEITELWREQSPKIILYGVNQPIVLSKRVTSFHWTIYPGVPLSRVDVE